MTACTTCGHDPVTGTHCPACGGWVVPAVPTVARFPLYADEVAPQPAPAPPVASSVSDTAEPPPVRGGNHAAERPPPGPLPLLVGVAVVLVFAVAGGALLLFGGGDGGSQAVDPATSPAEAAEGPPDGAAPETAAESASESSADPEPTETARLSPGDVAVPGTAAASSDNHGDPVTYEAANMFDDDPRTAWRVAGDAAGEVLTFRFDEPVTVTEVGLVNGYAKEDPPNDWYAANRRVLEVEWSFGDGASVRQELTEDRALQTVSVDAVETDVVELRLVEVSAAGSRDYTALSEVRLAGAGD